MIGLGIGTEGGGMIPDGSGGFVKDDRGAVVMSRLEPNTLRELADDEPEPSALATPTQALPLEYLDGLKHACQACGSCCNRSSKHSNPLTPMSGLLARSVRATKVLTEVKAGASCLTKGAKVMSKNKTWSWAWLMM